MTWTSLRTLRQGLPIRTAVLKSPSEVSRVNAIQGNLPVRSLTAAAGPAPSDRVELEGSAVPNMGRYKRSASPLSNAPVTVSITLKRPTELSVPTHPFERLSADTLKSAAATPAQMATMDRFAKSFGLAVTTADADTHTVKLSGTPQQLEKAFGVDLAQYTNGAGASFRAYSGKISLPRDVASTVEGVFGLDNRPIATPRMMHAPRFSWGYTASEIAGLYNFPKNLDGKGSKIAIIELGGGYQDKDLQSYWQKIGVKDVNVKSVSVDGAVNVPGAAPTGADGEVELDIELAGGVAPGADVSVYFAPNTEQGFIDAINQAAKDRPTSMSISWGAPEKEWSAQGLASLAAAVKDAAANGVNVYAAAGDNGSKDGEKDGKNHADFPASAPYSIGCGGTKLKSKHGQITGETVWDSWLGGATGGGVSDVFPETDFQKAGAKVPAPVNPAGGRGVPDVAGDADPTTGYEVIVDGTTMPIGGTSAVAPLYAGLTALLSQGVGGQLGFLAPTFYKHPEAFHDIIKGNNGGFSAGPGWDATTGVGTPDGTKILESLKAMQHA